jgi:hypothetical protein
MLLLTKEKKLYEALHGKQAFEHDVDSQKSFTPYNHKKGTPTWELWHEIIRMQIGCFKQDDKVAVWNPYAPFVLRQDFDVPARNITLLGLVGEDTKKNLANQIGINYTEVNSKNLTMMKNSQDYVIKNSPWDRFIRVPGVTQDFDGTYPYHAFGQIGHDLVKEGGMVIDILPSNWLGVDEHKAFRDWLLAKFDILELRIIKNDKQQVFAIANQDVVIMTARKNSNPDNSSVRFRYHGEQVFDLDLKYVNDKYRQWPLFKGKTGFDILENLMSHSQRMADENNRKTSQFYVEGEIKVHERDKVDPARNWTMNTPMGIKDAFRIHFETDQDAVDHFEWYKSDHFAYVFSSIKAHLKTMSNYVTLTGYHKFAKDKNGDIDVAKTFSLTSEQMEAIRRWKLSRS